MLPSKTDYASEKFYISRRSHNKYKIQYKTVQEFINYCFQYSMSCVSGWLNCRVDAVRCYSTLKSLANMALVRILAHIISEQLCYEL